MKPHAITSAVQLLVEGNDYRNFFEAFRDHLRISRMEIQNYGGVSELSGFLLALVKAPKFADVRHLGILSTTDDPRVSVGVAAKQGVWDFEHAAFSKVREFLSRLGAP